MYIYIYITYVYICISVHRDTSSPRTEEIRLNFYESPSLSPISILAITHPGSENIEG